MKTKSRFITSVLKTSEKEAGTALPWTRGAARAARIAKRTQTSLRKSA